MCPCVCECMREDASAPLTAHVTGVTGDVTVLIVYLTHFCWQTGLLGACGGRRKGDREIGRGEQKDTQIQLWSLMIKISTIPQRKGQKAALGAINRSFCTFTHMGYGDKLNGICDRKHHWLSANSIANKIIRFDWSGNTVHYMSASKCMQKWMCVCCEGRATIPVHLSKSS